MTEQQNPPQPTGIPLSVNLQYLKDLSFESPRAPQVFVSEGPQSQVGVNVRVDGRGVGENTYEITLHLEVAATAGDAQVFLLEMDYAGIFTVPQLIPEVLGPLLMIEHRCRGRLPAAADQPDRLRGPLSPPARGAGPGRARPGLRPRRRPRVSPPPSRSGS